LRYAGSNFEGVVDIPGTVSPDAMPHPGGVKARGVAAASDCLRNSRREGSMGGLLYPALKDSLPSEF
jgi:hypothetical protein